MKKSKYRRRKNVIRTIIITFCIIAILSIAVCVTFEHRLAKVTEQISSNIVKSAAKKIIGEAICDEFAESDITYGNIIEFEKDYSGRITALKTNMAEVNRLKANLAGRISDGLAKMDTAEINIPLGDIMGGKFMSGKGPCIKVKFVQYENVYIDVENELSDIGINLSKYRVLLKIKVSATIITSVTDKATEVETDICIAETVIVGEIPKTYAGIV